MARLDMAVDHGQTPEVARENFEKAITAAQERYGKWLSRMEWSPDRTAVTVAGTGFDVEISYDDRKVYARDDPAGIEDPRRSHQGFRRKSLE